MVDNSEALEKLALTKPQQAAFNRMKKAHRDCIKSGVHFEISFDKLTPMNGKNHSFTEEGEPQTNSEVDLDDVFGRNGAINLDTTPWVDCSAVATVKS